VSVVDFTPPAAPPEHTEGALEPYVRAIRTHWRVVVLVTLAALAGSVAWLVLRTPDYEATAQVLVAPLAQDETTFEGVDVLRADPSESTRTVQTAATLVDSAEAAELTARRLGPGWDRVRVQTAVEVEPQGQSNILSITAVAEGAELAARVANTFARSSLDVRGRRVREQAVDTMTRLLAEQAGGDREGQAAAELAGRIDRLEAASRSGDPTLSLSQRAFPPGSPVGAPAWLVLALSGIGGFTLGTGAALLMELTGRKIRDEDEIRRLYPLPVLAHVPQLARRRRRALTSATSTPPEIREAFRTVQVQLDREGEMPRALMITSPSTGDAKTTSAVNLAISLVGAGHRVMLMDLDLRKPDVARMLGIRTTRSLTALLSGHATLADLLVDAPQVPPLRVLPAGQNGELVLLEALSRQLPELLQDARSLADYVVVDTPPLGEVSDALRVLDVVDDVIVVARPGHTNRANLELTRNLIARSGRIPLGYLLIGEMPGRSSTYYAYGVGARHQGARSGVTRSADR
jgi:capsular exopolysaccharide synthesis family protein